MSKLAIIATIEVAPGRRDQVLPLLTAHRRRCLEDEPGTLAFEVSVPHDDVTKILLYDDCVAKLAAERRAGQCEQQ